MVEVSRKFMAAAERIIDRVGIDGDVIDQFLAERKESGARLDPATAEVYWKYTEVIDPYGLCDDLEPEERCIGRCYFARTPGSDWISFHDLPKKTAAVLWARIDAGEFDKDEEQGAWPITP